MYIQKMRVGTDEGQVYPKKKKTDEGQYPHCLGVGKLFEIH